MPNAGLAHIVQAFVNYSVRRAITVRTAKRTHPIHACANDGGEWCVGGGGGEMGGRAVDYQHMEEQSEDAKLKRTKSCLPAGKYEEGVQRGEGAKKERGGGGQRKDTTTLGLDQ